MGWKKIEPELGNMWDYKNLPEGSEFEGYFVKKEEGIGLNNSIKYTFKKDDEEIGIWGNTLLNLRFKNLVEGEKVKIEYKGQVKGSGPRPYYNFEVYHWIEDEEPDPTEKVENVNPDDIPF